MATFQGPVSDPLGRQLDEEKERGGSPGAQWEL